MAAFGLYSHIQSNKRRSVILLIGLFMLVYVLVFAGALFVEAWTHDAPIDQLLRAARFDLFKAAPFATIGAVVWIIIAYKFHQSMIDAITGGHEVTRQEEPKLYNLLENLCVSRGLPTPTLRIVDDDALNAFATGMNPKQYSISVTRGLLAALNDDEIEAVLAHELTHIQNGDVRMLVIAVVIAGVVSFFGEMIFRIFFQNAFYWGGGRSRSSSSSDSSDRKGGGAVIAIVIAVALIVVAWILAIVIRFALSRSREYLADAGSVELTKNPDAMISALRKIEGRGELAAANSAVMEMCIDNPRNEFMDLFATHPSVEARVKALVETAGGHDPGPLQIEPPLHYDAGPAQIDDDPNASAGPWGPVGPNAGPNVGPSGGTALPASGPTALPPPGAPGYDPFPPLPPPPPPPGLWPWGRKP